MKLKCVSAFGLVLMESSIPTSDVGLFVIFRIEKGFLSLLNSTVVFDVSSQLMLSKMFERKFVLLRFVLRCFTWSDILASSSTSRGLLKKKSENKYRLSNQIFKQLYNTIVLIILKIDKIAA